MVGGGNQLVLGEVWEFMQGCQSSGQPPGSIISVACQVEEVCYPSFVQLGKPFQAPVTVYNLYTLLNGAGGMVAYLDLSARDFWSSTKASQA